MSKYTGILPADILLPGKDIDLSRWAVIACDQYTAQPEYWRAVEQFAGSSPSALNIVFPEAYLAEGEGRIADINAHMRSYLNGGVLQGAVDDGFVLVERQISTGVRPGLIAKLDLEAYDFDPAAGSLIRATEGTILERIPPRVKIRKNAPLESTHILVLIDDPQQSVIEPVQSLRDELRQLYDFDLMQGGGHIRGYAVEGMHAQSVQAALERLLENSDGLLAAVGDGNHSLATARQCWLNMRASIPEGERAAHPARYALVEINNLHADAVQFEPIHRVLFGVDPQDVLDSFAKWCAARGYGLSDGRELTWLFAGREAGEDITGAGNMLPIAIAQGFLDEYLTGHPAAEIDYIHGEDVTRELAGKADAIGLLLTGIDKGALFPAIRQGGVLPRKTFSMGEAFEKRFYLECRRI